MAKEYARKAAADKVIEDAEDEAERQRALNDKRKYDDLVYRTTREAKAALEENEDIKEQCEMDAEEGDEFKFENEILRLKLAANADLYAGDEKLFSDTTKKNSELREAYNRLKRQAKVTKNDTTTNTTKNCATKAKETC